MVRNGVLTRSAESGCIVRTVSFGSDPLEITLLRFLEIRKMIFRVAVREIESWIMADREMFAKFLRIPESNVTMDPDVLMDPKAEVFRLVREKCTVTRFKKMLPVKNQAVGVDYNRLICEFVDGHWRVEAAMAHSPSFARSVDRIMKTLTEVA